MIPEIIETIELLKRRGFDNLEATQIILIQELKELKEVLRNG